MHHVTNRALACHGLSHGLHGLTVDLNDDLTLLKNVGGSGFLHPHGNEHAFDVSAILSPWLHHMDHKLREQEIRLLTELSEEKPASA